LLLLLTLILHSVQQTNSLYHNSQSHDSRTHVSLTCRFSRESDVNLKCRSLRIRYRVGASDSLPISGNLDVACKSAQPTGLAGKWRRRAADFLQLGYPSINFVLEGYVLCAVLQ